jgi:hypothetical protein
MASKKAHMKTYGLTVIDLAELRDRSGRQLTDLEAKSIMVLAEDIFVEDGGLDLLDRAVDLAILQWDQTN